MEVKKFKPESHKLKTLVYGKSGSWKTTLASTAPNPLFICSENWLASIAEKEPAYVEVKSVEDLESIYIELKKWVEYDTIIIDSISEIAKVIKESLTNSSKIDMNMQKRWKYGDKMMQIIRDITRLDYHIVCIVHEKVWTNEEGAIITRDIAVQWSAKEEIPSYFDVVAYTYLKWEEHFATCKPNQNLLTKDRLKCLPDQLPLDISEWISLFKQSVKIWKSEVIKKINIPKYLLKIKEKLDDNENKNILIEKINNSSKLTDQEKEESLLFINSYKCTT